MPVIIKKAGKPICSHCGGGGIASHEIESQGKKVIMTLPCYLCRPIKGLTHQMLMQSTAQQQILDHIGLSGK